MHKVDHDDEWEIDPLGVLVAAFWTFVLALWLVLLLK